MGILSAVGVASPPWAAERKPLTVSTKQSMTAVVPGQAGEPAVLLHPNSLGAPK